MANGARRSAPIARPASRQAPELRARWRRVRVARDPACEIVAYGMTGYSFSIARLADFRRRDRESRRAGGLGKAAMVVLNSAVMRELPLKEE